MKTELGCGVQDVGAGPDHGGGSEPPNFRSQIADCRLQARRAATGCCALTPGRAGRKKEQCRMKRRSPRKPRRGGCPLSWHSNGEIFAYVRLCSPMFAFWEKNV